ncbi:MULTISPECIES: MBL fold metallo-hydrolase [Streptomyces]|uniref:MBL fold metallo-hydrolase n=2 Tax=Streptomyces rimosus subsp. rimosus TaxID=132474 RepID=L8EZU7_STRR1|nr:MULTISPECIES: MBL fold metallo-hydrolase [Streptomyces]KOG69790.1 sulfurtransferase [Kitasatospora aureofaciens]MYT41589.1 MBL fold metallo-hydrolase [Streptomyces sp. SID5471]KEF20009.1 sulfurtransferase [Streptomyces rimosus]KUJ27847.1 sulfurtransferase [Streptomyces rimosus subsp. rimosus]QDA06352.1 MBL fold metallo-hydrolase [Streptomyces rimosus]
MHFAQYYLDCLSQASYLIGDETTGRAVLVDPRRDIDDYLRDAEAAGLRIELIIETHFHADFLSGHLELARATGATIAFGEAAETGYPIRRLRDGERIFLGVDAAADGAGGVATADGAAPAAPSGVTLTVLATPGHTPESICIVVHEQPDAPEPYGVLTGDTLFVGDVGRPDLLAATGLTPEEMAGRLHRSLHDKLLTLPDATRVFPAHGAGSACGRNLSTETTSTIGEQRRYNYALQPMPEDEFVRLVTAGQPATPGYFAHDAALNRDGHPLLDTAPPAALTLDAALAACRDAGAVLLDSRPLAAYTEAHFTGSLHTSLDTRFAEYAGSVVEPGTPIVLISDPGTESEARLRLARIGYDHVLGHVPDPAAELVRHPDLVTRTHRLAAGEAPPGDAQLIDVRNPSEYAAGALPNAVNLPLATLPTSCATLDPGRPVVLYCRSGSRSVIAAALLEARGFRDVRDIVGGYEGAVSACG